MRGVQRHTDHVVRGSRDVVGGTVSESVMVKFEGSDRVNWVTPAKARTMTRKRQARDEKGKPLVDKNGNPVMDEPDAIVVSRSPFVIRVRKTAARRYPHVVRWTASSAGHVMMGAALMQSVISVAERAHR
jgi:hypothetical protein